MADQNGLRKEYYPVAPPPNESPQLFEPGVAERLLGLAKDTAWLLWHGNDLAHSGHMAKLYDNWLRVKKHRDHTVRQATKGLRKTLLAIMGKHF